MGPVKFALVAFAVVIAPVTNSVVAIWVELFPAVAVGAKGVPVKVGDAKGAFKFKAVCPAVETGLFASLVLSTLPKPTSPLTMPVGVVIEGLVNDLFVNVSAPANVAKVPVIGSVTFVTAVVVNVVAKAPDVVKFPPKVIVLSELFTPVPPY